MKKDKFYKLLRNIPKAEIHLHSEALISKKTAKKILSRKDSKYKDKKNIDQLFKYDNLKDFIKTFLLIQSAFEEIRDFKELFKNIQPYLKRNGIVYAEIFFSPSNFVKNGIKFEDIMDVLIKEINRIKRREKINVKAIIDVSRTFGLENAKKNLDYVINCKCENIIGIGLGGDERKGSAKEFESVFRIAKQFRYHRVAHAGEDVGPESIWNAIRYLEVERIGHGISAINDLKLINYLVKTQIPLEICPTSNIFIGRFVKKIENHPIKELYKNGVLVTLNTDDPAFFNVELLDEYWNLYSKLHFSLEDIKKIIINGFKASFIDEKVKKEYIGKVDFYWEKYLSNQTN